MSSVKSLVESYLAGIGTLRQAVAGMSRQQLIARPIAGKWSTLEVVCHLVDSDQAWMHRMKCIIAEDKPLLIGYDESRFVNALAYHERDLDVELTIFDKSRQQMACILGALPVEALNRAGIHSERGLITLEESIRIEIEHVPHHVQFIAAKRKLVG